MASNGSDDKIPAGETVLENAAGDTGTNNTADAQPTDPEPERFPADMTETTEPEESTEATIDKDSNDVEPADDSEEKKEADEKDKWVFILGHERLKKRVLKEGEGLETRPKPKEIATIKVEGKLSDGTVVDKHDALSFYVSDGDIVQALDLSVSLMEKGEISEIYTEAQYAYGSIGRKPDILSEASITYEVELLKVESAPIIATLPVTTRNQMGEEKRERGNYHYSRQDFSSAIHSYTRALEFLSLEDSLGSSDEDMKQLCDIRLKCYNNMAASQLKIEAFDACISSCDEVLKLEKDNVKALFRKGKAYSQKGDLEDAIAIMRIALKAEPESKIIHQELSRLVNKRNIMNQSEREMYQRMLGGDKTSQESKSKGGWSSLAYVSAGAVVAGILSVGIAMYKTMQ